MFFRHFDAKFFTKRLNIRGVVIVYLVPSMKFYYLLRRYAFHNAAADNAFPGKMLCPILTAENVVPLSIKFERVDRTLDRHPARNCSPAYRLAAHPDNCVPQEVPATWERQNV